MNRIQAIINDYFDFDFFWRQDSQKKPLINNLARDFQSKHPNAIVNIIQKVKTVYPELSVKRYTYFIEEDRCLTFEIRLPNHDTVVCRSEEHTSELQSRENLVCRLLSEKKKN